MPGVGRMPDTCRCTHARASVKWSELARIPRRLAHDRPFRFSEADSLRELHMIVSTTDAVPTPALLSLAHFSLLY